MKRKTGDSVERTAAFYMDVSSWCRVSMWDPVLVFFKWHWPVGVRSGTHKFPF